MVRHKWFWVWEFDREEKWLNEMSAKGYELVDVGFATFYFERCTPGQYTVRLEMLDRFPGSYESGNYIHFVEETGAKYVGSVLGWVYFKRESSMGEFQLYSDHKGKLAHLNRIRLLLTCVLFSQFCYIISNLSSYISHRNRFAFALIMFCTVFDCLIAFGMIKISRMISRLKKSNDLFE